MTTPQFVLQSRPAASFQLETDLQFVDRNGLVTASSSGVTLKVPLGEVVRLVDREGLYCWGRVRGVLSRVYLVEPDWDTIESEPEITSSPGSDWFSGNHTV